MDNSKIIKKKIVYKDPIRKGYQNSISICLIALFISIFLTVNPIYFNSEFYLIIFVLCLVSFVAILKNMMQNLPKQLLARLDYKYIEEMKIKIASGKEQKFFNNDYRLFLFMLKNDIRWLKKSSYKLSEDEINKIDDILEYINKKTDSLYDNHEVIKNKYSIEEIHKKKIN